MLAIIKTYGKALAAGVGAALIALASVITGGITPTEGVQVGVAFLGAVAVWNTTNLPDGAPFAKAVTAALAAGGVLVVALPDGLTSAEIVNVVIAAVAVFGVFRVPQPLSSRPRPGSMMASGR